MLVSINYEKHFTTNKFIFYLLTSEAQTKPSNFIITGRIINKVNLGADCGYFKLATIIEFEIIEPIKKRQKLKNLPIIVRCVEFYEKNFFETGKLYKLEISYEDSGENFDYKILNPEILEKNKLPKKYWAQNILELQ